MIHFGKYLRATYNKVKKQIEEEYEVGRSENEELDVNTEKKLIKLVENRVKEELKCGVQILQYQINALNVINGKEPDITLFLHIEKDDEYIKENSQIIEEVLKQKYEGCSEKIDIKDIPKIVYVINQFNSLQGRRV